jgi:hypothetical protein
MRNKDDDSATGPLTSFRDLIERLPSLAEISRELNVPFSTVASWKRRDFIPSGYWEALAAYAKRIDSHKRWITVPSLRRLSEKQDALRIARARDLRRTFESESL